jgi:hypothetical protein
VAIAKTKFLYFTQTTTWGSDTTPVGRPSDNETAEPPMEELAYLVARRLSGVRSAARVGYLASRHQMPKEGETCLQEKLSQSF